jgi:RNA polymerase sigma-70 factor (ECF subfamily)
MRCSGKAHFCDERHLAKAATPLNVRSMNGGGRRQNPRKGNSMPLRCRKAAAVALPGAPQAGRRRSNPSWRAGAKAASRTGHPNVLRAASDEALIGRIAHGDRLAMHVLYARHHVAVFRSVLGLLHDRCMAEDVISEVFLDVWRQADRFEGRSAVLTWMLGIARFKALSALRNRSHNDWDEQAVAAIEDPADDPATALQKKDTGAILRKCLAKLSPAHREIIDLVYYHEKTVAEVAEIVGIPGNTVKTRMFNARRHLARLLKAAGIRRA